jgi:hypothetical protein
VVSASRALRLGALASLVLASGACQLFLGGEDYVLDPGSGGSGGGGGASTTTSSGGGATTTTTTTSSVGGGGEGGQGGGGGAPPDPVFGTPDVLVTGRGSLLELTVVDTTLYYVVDGDALQTGRIEALSTTGGTPTTAIPSLTEPRGVAVDATHVYTSTGPLDATDTLCHVVRAPRAGGATQDLQTATAPGGAGAVETCYADVAVGAGRGFASLVALSEHQGNAHVRSTLVTGGASVATGLAAIDSVPISALFATSTQLFWVDPSSGRLLRAAADNAINNLNGAPPGPGVTTVAEGFTQASDVAVRLDVAYVLSAAGVAAVPAQQSGATPTVLTSSVNAPRGLSADATHLYWTDGSTREVRAIPVAGGASEVIWLPATESPIDTVATGNAVFVITAEGSVARIDKTVD